MGQQQLVLLHGWMSQPSCWDMLVPYLIDYQVSHLILPGHHPFASDATFKNPTQLLADLAENIPPRATVLAWSLGGTLAQLVAATYPDKIAHLICVCSNLKFVASDDWPYGMQAQQFAQFSQDFDDDPQTCVKKFIGLQSMGDSHSSALRQHLKRCSPDLQDTDELRAGLQMLGASDTREMIQGFDKPVSFIAGQNDQLASAESLEASSQLVKDGRFYCVAGSAHAPMLSQPKLLAHLLKECISQ